MTDAARDHSRSIAGEFVPCTDADRVDVWPAYPMAPVPPSTALSLPLTDLETELGPGACEG